MEVLRAHGMGLRDSLYETPSTGRDMVQRRVFSKGERIHASFKGRTNTRHDAKAQ